MKYLILGTVLALAVPLTSGIGVANAQDVRISVGDRDHWRGEGWRRHHFHGAYAYDRGCRVVVTQRINRFGDRVTVRKRICY